MLYAREIIYSMLSLGRSASLPPDVCSGFLFLGLVHGGTRCYEGRGFCFTYLFVSLKTQSRRLLRSIPTLRNPIVLSRPKGMVSSSLGKKRWPPPSATIAIPPDWTNLKQTLTTLPLHVSSKIKTLQTTIDTFRIILRLSTDSSHPDWVFLKTFEVLKKLWFLNSAIICFVKLCFSTFFLVLLVLPYAINLCLKACDHTNVLQETKPILANQWYI